MEDAEEADALAALATRNHGVFTTEQSRAMGYSVTEQRRLLQTSAWVALARGKYALGSHWRSIEGDMRTRHILRCRAYALGQDPDFWFSHESAAHILGLTLLKDYDGPVQVTRVGQRCRPPDGVQLHFAPVDPSQRSSSDALSVTSVARTLCDLARTTSFTSAVVSADAALQRGSVQLAELNTAAAMSKGWPGIGRARRAFTASDGRAESPGETLSRLVIIASSLPPPELQVSLNLSGVIVRPDFLWREARLVGEFDGRLKYGGSDALFREKTREDRLRDHGFHVVRWTWGEVVGDSDRLIERIRHALARAHRLSRGAQT